MSGLGMSLCTGAMHAQASAGAPGGDAIDAEATARVEATTRVALVEVPVVVHDAARNPVRALRADQLRLFDAGVEQPIARFEVVDRAALADLDAVDAMARVPATARRRVLFLFDLELASPRALASARAAALEVAAEHLLPGDLAGVATLDALRGVRWLLAFGSDRAQLARAIRTLGVPGLVRGPPTADPLRFTLEAPSSLASWADTASLDVAALAADAELARLVEQLERLRTEADRGRGVERATRWVRALGALGEALTVVESGTEVLLFSEGFDARLFAGTGTTPESGAPGLEPEADALFGSSALRSELTDALEALRRADAVVHAVDVGGLRAAVGASASAPADGGGSGAPRRDALFRVADATGGLLVADSARLGEALDRVLATRDVVYLVSFYPPADAVPGAWRPLRITTDVPGLTVHHRPGYRLAPGFADLPALERDLLAATDLVDARPRTELPLALLVTAFPSAPQATLENASGETADGASARAPQSYVPLVLELPSAGLADVAEDDAPPCRLEVYALATDLDGRISGVHAQTLEIDHRRLVDPAIDRVQYYGHFELPAGRHLVRALVRDVLTGRTGTASTTLEVPSWDAPHLLPPLVPDDAAGALRVREAGAAPAGGGGRLYPFLVDGLPFVPSPSPRFTPAHPRRLVVALHGLAPPVRLEAHLLMPDGTRLPVDLAPSQLDGPFATPVHRVTVGARLDSAPAGRTDGRSGRDSSRRGGVLELEVTAQADDGMVVSGRVAVELDGVD
ncbi:MAG: VWA domain-containing protein [Acidobacteriota bacterium]